HGHEKLKLLDGGRKKWELESRALVTEVPDRKPTQYTAKDEDSSLPATRDEVLSAIGERNLVDVRSPDEFVGRLLAPAHLPQEPATRAVPIPTAKDIPWEKAANAHGMTKSDEELREHDAEAARDEKRGTIASCRLGEPAAHTWFALDENLDRPNVKNYDGSWN